MSFYGCSDVHKYLGLGLVLGFIYFSFEDTFDKNSIRHLYAFVGVAKTYQCIRYLNFGIFLVVQHQE